MTNAVATDGASQQSILQKETIENARGSHRETKCDKNVNSLVSVQNQLRATQHASCLFVVVHRYWFFCTFMDIVLQVHGDSYNPFK